MTNKRKICVVITARPSYSRIRTALKAIQEHSNLELQLVVAASALLERYGNVLETIESDGFKVNARVYMVVEGENLASSAKTTGIGLMELGTVFDNLKPDIVVTIADRYETIATAIAAAYMNIPLAHIQGGEMTGSIDDKVRHAITKLADYHLVSTQKAAERVTRMGEDAQYVFVTGCPSIDIAAAILRDPGGIGNPFEKHGGVGADVDITDGYLVVMQHPVTNEYEMARRHVTETLYAVRDTGLPTLWFWPNVDAGSDGTSNGIRAFVKLKVQKISTSLRISHPKISCGWSITAAASLGTQAWRSECSFLGIPAVNIGSRQAGRERGPNVIDVGYNRQEIAQAIKAIEGHTRPEGIPLYGDGHAGERIADTLAKVPLKFTKRLTY